MEIIYYAVSNRGRVKIGDFMEILQNGSVYCSYIDALRNRITPEDRIFRVHLDFEEIEIDNAKNDSAILESVDF